LISIKKYQNNFIYIQYPQVSRINIHVDLLKQLLEFKGLLF